MPFTNLSCEADDNFKAAIRELARRRVSFDFWVCWIKLRTAVDTMMLGFMSKLDWNNPCHYSLF